MGILEGTQTTNAKFWSAEASRFQADQDKLTRDVLIGCALCLINVQMDYVHGSVTSFRVWTVLPKISKLAYLFGSLGLPIANCRLERKATHPIFYNTAMHCIKGTSGANNGLVYPKFSSFQSFSRGYHANDHSIFSAIGFPEWLSARNIHTLFLVGCDLKDSGVASAQQALSQGYNAVVPLAAFTVDDSNRRQGSLTRTTPVVQSLINLGATVI